MRALTTTTRRSTRLVLVALALMAVAVAAHAVLVAPSAAAVEAQGLQVDVAEPGLLGEDTVLRPAIPPGGAATFELLVTNVREQPAEVVVYGADASPTGEVAAGTDNQGVGAWITVDQQRLGLPGGQPVTVAVTVARPADDADGGTAAVVVQLSESARRELALERIQRAAVLVEVAADGSGDGLHAEVVGTAQTRRLAGLVPDVLTLEVRYADPSGDDDTVLDGSVVLARPLTDDPSHPATVEVLPPGGRTTTTVEVDLPWYGLLATAHAEAATVGLTTRSAPVRIVVVPQWAVIVVVLLAAWATWRARRHGGGIELGRVPPSSDEPASPGPGPGAGPDEP